jgi:hypothetical protein
MQTYRPAGGANTFGQLLLRWGFSILALSALWLAIDRMGDWSQDFSLNLDADLNLWLQAIGLFVLSGLLFGIAIWLPVPGRGGRPSTALGLGIPLLLLNAGYAVLFHIDFSDLPDFLQSRLLIHPLLSLTAASIMALALGVALIAGFCPAGYVPLSRLTPPPRYEPRAYPAPAAPAPPPRATPPPPPPKAPDAMGRPDNQQTREFPPGEKR